MLIRKSFCETTIASLLNGMPDMTPPVSVYVGCSSTALIASTYMKKETVKQLYAWYLGTKVVC